MFVLGSVLCHVLAGPPLHPVCTSVFIRLWRPLISGNVLCSPKKSWHLPRKHLPLMSFVESAGSFCFRLGANVQMQIQNSGTFPSLFLPPPFFSFTPSSPPLSSVLSLLADHLWLVLSSPSPPSRFLLFLISPSVSSWQGH